MDFTTIADVSYKSPMYVGFTAAFTPPATPTDCFVIEGVASKTVKIWRLFLSTIQTTAGINTWFVNKHSTANAGGTPVTTTKVPLNAAFPAAASLMQHYTANPTPGTSLGSVLTTRVNSPAPATAGASSLAVTLIDFSLTIGFPVVLSGAAQGLALNFNGAALPAGLSVVAGMMWSEE